MTASWICLAQVDAFIHLRLQRGDVVERGLPRWEEPWAWQDPGSCFENRLGEAFVVGGFDDILQVRGWFSPEAAHFTGLCVRARMRTRVSTLGGPAVDGTGIPSGVGSQSSGPSALASGIRTQQGARLASGSVVPLHSDAVGRKG